MLKLHEVNWFNLTNTRRVAHCPPHFELARFERKTDERIIVNWIYENLEGRFWFDNIQHRTGQEGKLALSACVGFEIPGESSYFSLMLDKINRYELLF